ncbi:endonuclease Q family protein [Flavonifractor plautii]|nr:endonuclease Q family protein [Flavonifractor plautii]
MAHKALKNGGERMVKEIAGRWWYCCPVCGKKLHPSSREPCVMG